MNSDQISEIVYGILSKQLNVPIEKINSNSLIVADLGADSLDTAEIALMIKEQFEYDLSEKEMLSTKKVNDLIEILNKGLLNKISNGNN